MEIPQDLVKQILKGEIAAFKESDCADRIIAYLMQLNQRDLRFVELFCEHLVKRCGGV